METVRLHLKLSEPGLSKESKRILTRYGEATKEGAFTRDILIPSDMPLHNLHYAIQKLFGWKNCHLRHFLLPVDVFQTLTGGTVKGWAPLVGVLFQSPSEFETSLYWDDDYEKGSISAWLKRKYTGPYLYQGWMEEPQAAQRDVKDLLERFPMVEVQESFEAYMERTKGNRPATVGIVRKAPLLDLTLEEMTDTIDFEGSRPEDLLERLPVVELLGHGEERLKTDGTFPVAEELLYEYDYGDDWCISITKKQDATDLLQGNHITEAELLEAEKTVKKTHRPVCIHREGITLMDDVGGLSGFAEFLHTLYEGQDKEEEEELRSFAKLMGWSDKKVTLKKML